MQRLKDVLKKNKRVVDSYNTLLVIKQYLQADKVRKYNTEKDGERYFVLRFVNSQAGFMTVLMSVLTWLNYAISHGYILVTDISIELDCYRNETDADNSGRVGLDEYIDQPMVVLSSTDSFISDVYSNHYYMLPPSHSRFGMTIIHPVCRMISRIVPPKIKPPMIRDYKERPKAQARYCELYEQYIHYTPSVQRYLDDEVRGLLLNKGIVLGVLVRGTDYTQQRPHNHPIQPPVSDVIKLVQNITAEHPWDYLYLATDERRTEDLFTKTFPGKVIVNKRCYYDGEYTNRYLCDVKSDRENDEYLRNLEYLSSMNLLAHCDMFIGGLCTGSQAVLIMRGNRQFEYCHLFDLGNY